MVSSGATRLAQLRSSSRALRVRGAGLSGHVSHRLPDKTARDASAQLPALSEFLLMPDSVDRRFAPSFARLSRPETAADNIRDPAVTLRMLLPATLTGSPDPRVLADSEGHAIATSTGFLQQKVPIPDLRAHRRNLSLATGTLLDEARVGNLVRSACSRRSALTAATDCQPSSLRRERLREAGGRFAIRPLFG
ncbi:hypothetical protein PSPO01_13347 [Paraphaeosphaeria sporulosa]